MSGMQFISDLAVVMVIAGAVAWLCQRIGLSAVVGYLVAGIVIGPHTPPFALVADLDRVQRLAEVGLVFLIFSIGLNLSLGRMKRLGLSIVVATAVAAVLVLNGGRALGWALGWSSTAGLFMAAMLMVSSSAIISRVLDELNLAHERSGQLALGMTVLEDVVAVTMLTLLTALTHWGESPSPSLFRTMGGLAGFIVCLALLSLLIVPRLLARLSQEAQSEIRTLLVAGLLLSLAWLAVRAGYSLALGAFVFGAIVGSTRYKADIERKFGGLREIFGAVFFVAVGMQVDLSVVADAWPLVLAVTALALLLRPLACALGFIAAGSTSQESIRAGLALVPLGEFSFIIAQLGVEQGVLPSSAYAVAVGASLLTSLAAPVMIGRAEFVSRRIVRLEPLLIREWVTFYHDWLARLRSRQSASLLWRVSRKRLFQITLQMLAVSTLIIVAAPIYVRAAAVAGEDWLFPNALGILFWTGFGLILLGPLIALWRNIEAMAMIVADSATAGSPRQETLRPLLEAALRMVAVVVLAAWLLALLPSGWSLLSAAGGVLLLLIVISVFFRRRFVRLHSRLEIELREQFHRASRTAATSAWTPALPGQPEDWQLDIDEVTLPSDTAHAGQTLGQLALRARFGCSVVGIDRQGYAMVNPRADVALFPQDKLLLLGAPERLAKAVQELSRTSAGAESLGGFAELTMETVTVPPDSPLVGKTLLELDLIRQVGVQIGGIRRESQRALAPSGSERLEADDELLVLGTHTQIQDLSALLAAPSPEKVQTRPG